MSRLRRRLLLVGILILGALAGAASWLQRPARLALERAEALQFRRMQVARLEEEGRQRA
jgi:hypothetical protein